VDLLIPQVGGNARKTNVCAISSFSRRNGKLVKGC
jgi:hypothetical protein